MGERGRTRDPRLLRQIATQLLKPLHAVQYIAVREDVVAHGRLFETWARHDQNRL